MSIEADSRSLYGDLERHELDGTPVAVSQRDPRQRGPTGLVRWPGPLAGLMPLLSGWDEFYQLGRMIVVRHSSERDPEGALQEATDAAAPYVTHGRSLLALVQLHPHAHDEQAIPFHAEGLGLVPEASEPATGTQALGIPPPAMPGLAHPVCGGLRTSWSPHRHASVEGRRGHIQHVPRRFETGPQGGRHVSHAVGRGRGAACCAACCAGRDGNPPFRSVSGGGARTATPRDLLPRVSARDSASPTVPRLTCRRSLVQVQVRPVILPEGFESGVRSGYGCCAAVV